MCNIYFFLIKPCTTRIYKNWRIWIQNSIVNEACMQLLIRNKRAKNINDSLTGALAISRSLGSLQVPVALPDQPEDVVDGVPGSGVGTGHHPHGFNVQPVVQHTWGVFTTVRIHRALLTDWSWQPRFGTQGRFGGRGSPGRANKTPPTSIMESIRVNGGARQL